ncbi:MAG: hypothetical protein ACRC6X_07975 [Culicoidibacterales bacterium]
MRIVGFILHYNNVVALFEELKYDAITNIDQSADPEEFMGEMMRYFNLFSAVTWSKESLDDYLYNVAKELYKKSGLTNGPKYPEIKEKNKRKLKIKQWHLDTYFKYRVENGAILAKLDELKQLRNRFIHSNNSPIVLKENGQSEPVAKVEVAAETVHYDGKTKKYYEAYYKSGDELLAEMNKANIAQFIELYEQFILTMLEHPSNKGVFVEAFRAKNGFVID